MPIWPHVTNTVKHTMHTNILLPGATARAKGYTYEQAGTYHTKHMHMHLTGRHAVTPNLTQPHFSEAQHTVPGHTAAFSNRAQKAL